jgi:hypothetical protein
VILVFPLLRVEAEGWNEQENNEQGMRKFEMKFELEVVNAEAVPHSSNLFLMSALLDYYFTFISKFILQYSFLNS